MEDTTMKKKVLLLLLLLTVPASWLRAQEVETRPVSEDHKVWRFNYLYFITEYLTDGDTLIAGNHCYRLYKRELKFDEKEYFSSNGPFVYDGGEETYFGYYGAIFDEGRKTYFIKPDTTEPILQLDFDVSEGDTFYLQGYEMWVEKDTIYQSCGHTYRSLRVHNMTLERSDPDHERYAPGYWIQGIWCANKNPYFTVTYYWFGTFWYQFLECSVNGEVICRNPRYNPDTDMIEPESVKQPDRTSPIYDLQGRRVNSPLRPGIYIQNGKAFVVK